MSRPKTALPLRQNGLRASGLPPQPIPASTTTIEVSWSHRQDRVAGAMAESDGWVWTNLDRRKRDYWRRLADAAMNVMEDV